MRLFIAVHASEDLQKQLVSILPQLSRYEQYGLKYSHSDAWHLTFKFLGEVAEERLNSIINTFEQSTRSCSSFDLCFSGFSCFPGPPAPIRIVYAGFRENESMLSYVQSLENAFSALGFPREERPFTAHLTLARYKPPFVNQKLRAMLADFSFQNVQQAVSRVQLLQSKQQGNSRKYEVLAEADLLNLV